MRLNRPVGKLTRVGTCSIFINDFSQYQSQSLPGTSWALWPNVGPLHRVQSAMIDAHSKAMDKMRAIREDADLTGDAKERRSVAVFDAFVDAVKSGLPTVQETADNLAAYAISKLLPVLSLASGDVVGATLDAECRAYTSDLDDSTRNTFLMSMRQGDEPRIAAAVLRAPGPISGFTQDQVVKLGAAGIAVAYPDAAITLGKLAVGVREILMGANSLAMDVITNGVQIDKKESDVKAWADPGEGYAKLVAWLEPIPIELPGSTSPPEAVHTRGADDSDQEDEAA